MLLEFLNYIKYDKYTYCHAFVKKLKTLPKKWQFVKYTSFYMNMCS